MTQGMEVVGSEDEAVPFLDAPRNGSREHLDVEDAIGRPHDVQQNRVALWRNAAQFP